jgi:DNA-binding NtrC family response regulator
MAFRAPSTAQDEKPKQQNVIKPEPHILLIDDQVLAREQLKRIYTANGYAVHTVGTAEDGLKCVNSQKMDVVVLGSGLLNVNGTELIAQLQRDHPGVSIILTGYPPMAADVPDMKKIGCEYMGEPFDSEAAHRATDAALDKAYVFSESVSFRQSLNDADGEFGFFLSKTPAMHQVFESIRMVAPTSTTVFLEGEAGTGKELIASAIHYQSSRRDGPFIAINCAAYPDFHLETELFGCEDGARVRDELKRPGNVKLADGGTLFLDEIESMDPFVQTKFLQVLEDCNSLHLGAQQSLDSDVRVIAASNVPLQDLVAKGKMRPDLYYRINVVPIHILPLRERAGDIPLLIEDFLRCHPIANRKGIVGVSHETIARLIQYQWPGNIRELQNVLEKAIVLTKGSVIENIDLPFAKEPVD